MPVTFDRQAAELAIRKLRLKEALTDADLDALAPVDDVLVARLKARDAPDDDDNGPDLPDIIAPQHHTKPAMLGTVNAAVVALWEVVCEVGRRCTGLALRVAELEARGPSCEWLGVHENARAYPAGALCTRSGSLWLARKLTTATPGQSEDWTLIVKNGSYREGA